MITYEVHPTTPQKRALTAAVQTLSDDGGIAIYPTDTVYGLGACITNPNGLNKIAKIIERKKDTTFSFICSDFSQVSEYVKLSNSHYRLMKRYLPGPYTFILNATNLVPKKIMPKRKTVGVRMPDSAVILELVKMLGCPVANTSVHLEDEEHAIDPHHIRECARLQNEVDIMLDAGMLETPEPSTVIDLTGGEPVLVREGKGVWYD